MQLHPYHLPDPEKLACRTSIYPGKAVHGLESGHVWGPAVGQGGAADGLAAVAHAAPDHGAPAGATRACPTLLQDF